MSHLLELKVFPPTKDEDIWNDVAKKLDLPLVYGGIEEENHEEIISKKLKSGTVEVKEEIIQYTKLLVLGQYETLSILLKRYNKPCQIIIRRTIIIFSAVRIHEATEDDYNDAAKFIQTGVVIAMPSMIDKLNEFSKSKTNKILLKATNKSSIINNQSTQLVNNISTGDDEICNIIDEIDEYIILTNKLFEKFKNVEDRITLWGMYTAINEIFSNKKKYVTNNNQSPRESPRSAHRIGSPRSPRADSPRKQNEELEKIEPIFSVYELLPLDSKTLLHIQNNSNVTYNELEAETVSYFDYLKAVLKIKRRYEGDDIKGTSNNSTNIILNIPTENTSNNLGNIPGVQNDSINKNDINIDDNITNTSSNLKEDFEADRVRRARIRKFQLNNHTNDKNVTIDKILMAKSNKGNKFNGMLLPLNTNLGNSVEIKHDKKNQNITSSLTKNPIDIHENLKNKPLIEYMSSLSQLPFPMVPSSKVLPNQWFHTINFWELISEFITALEIGLTKIDMGTDISEFSSTGNTKEILLDSLKTDYYIHRYKMIKSTLYSHDTNCMYTHEENYHIQDSMLYKSDVPSVFNEILVSMSISVADISSSKENITKNLPNNSFWYHEMEKFMYHINKDNKELLQKLQKRIKDKMGNASKKEIENAEMLRNSLVEYSSVGQILVMKWEVWLSFVFNWLCPLCKKELKDLRLIVANEIYGNVLRRASKNAKIEIKKIIAKKQRSEEWQEEKKRQLEEMKLKRKQFLELDLYGLSEVTNEKKELLSSNSSNSDIMAKSPSYKRLLRVSTDEKDLVPASPFDDKQVDQKVDDNINTLTDQIAESKGNLDIDQIPGVTRVDSREEINEEVNEDVKKSTTITETKEFEQEVVYVKYDILSSRQFIDGFSHGEYYKATIIKKSGDCVDVLYNESQLVEQDVALEYIKRIDNVN